MDGPWELRRALLAAGTKESYRAALMAHHWAGQRETA